MSKRKPTKRPWYKRLFTRASEDTFERPSRDSSRGAFKGGRRSRRNDSWYVTGADPDSAVGSSMKTMRERVRDLDRNNDYAHSALVHLTTHAALLYPQSSIKAVPDADGNVSDEERNRVRALNRQIDEVFRAWSDVCMVDGPGTFLTAQLQATKGMFESGETFTRRRVRRMTDGLPVPLQLQILEGDLVDHGLTEVLPDNRGHIRQGVEYDAIGRRRGYHMFRMHPGDSLLGFDALDRVFVRQDQCAHLYAKPFSRPNQSRGVPWLHAVIQKLLDYGGLEDAELVRARGAASLMAFVESQEQYDYGDESELPEGINPVRRSDGTILERLRPGTVGYLDNGQVVKFNTPPPFEGFKDLAWQQLHAIASGSLVPYEVLTGDLSGTNFSSIMFGMGMFWRVMRVMQHECVVPLWCARVWRWFVELGVLSGALPAEAGPVRWVARPFPMVDPVKQNRGKLIAVRAGAETLEDWIAETGKDPDEVLQSHDRLQRWARERGLVLDSIPNTTTLAGQVQEAPEWDESRDEPERPEDDEDDAQDDADVDDAE